MKSTKLGKEAKSKLFSTNASKYTFFMQEYIIHNFYQTTECKAETDFEKICSKVRDLYITWTAFIC